jgi:signal peptide peptidase SppA
MEQDKPCAQCESADANSGSYPQLVRSLCERPWAITEEALLGIREIVSLRVQGIDLTDDQKRERIGATSYAARKPMGYGVPQGGGNATVVAVLPLYGVIIPKASLFSDVSGASSVEGFRRMFREALNDRDVSAIVIDVDSPGGQTDLITELCAEIRDARGEKPIVAVANTLCCSAAYWIASQADEVVGTPSAKVGSIGVFCVHDDISAMQEKAGVKTTLIYAGTHKVDGNPFEPLSDTARKDIQARVDAAYDLFVADIAAGRGVDESKIRSGYGEGRVLDAKAALSEGMIDRLDTLEATVRRVAGETATPGAMQAAANGATGFHASGYISGTGFAGTDPATAAMSGHSYAEVAEAAHAAVALLGTRTGSLAEFKRGRLSATKRDQLAAVVAECDALTDALDATDPDKRRATENALTLEDEWALSELGLAT